MSEHVFIDGLLQPAIVGSIDYAVCVPVRPGIVEFIAQGLCLVSPYIGCQIN